MWRGRELGGGKAQSSEKVMEYEPACGGGGIPTGAKTQDGRGFSLCFIFSSFSRLIFKFQCEEPNLLVLFYCLCLAFLQSIQHLKMTMKPSLCLWPLQVAGSFPTVHSCVSFKDETSVHSTFRMRCPSCILVPEPL